MDFTAKKYSKVKELANDIKCALNSYNNKTMFHLLHKKLTRGELKQFLGKTLDDDNNRALAFIGGSLCKTMCSIFKQVKTGEPRKTLFIELLLEYDREVYGTLLADLNT
jgi:hypothetical protein